MGNFDPERGRAPTVPVGAPKGRWTVPAMKAKDQPDATSGGTAAPVTEAAAVEADLAHGRIARWKDRWIAAHERVEVANRRVQESRTHLASVDVVLSFQEDDRDAGGSLLGGAIAFRLFLWLLPAALLVVAGLGIDSAADPTSPSNVASTLGIRSIAAQSIDQAAKEAQTGRWLAVVFGVVFLYTTSVALVKALFVAHALIWQIPVPRIAHKPRVVGQFLLATLIIAGCSSLAAIIRNHSPGYGLVAMLGVVLIYGGAWWLFSLRLPHGDASFLDLLPGAVLFGIGAEVLHLVAVYYLAAKLTHASILYGTLGGSAALLFGLYLVGRLLIAATVLNATMWDRHHTGENGPVEGGDSEVGTVGPMTTTAGASTPTASDGSLANLDRG